MSGADLDDRETVERLDPEGLLARIEALPEQCEEAWQRARSLELPAAHAGASDIVLLGMGGSAISGDIVRSLSAASGGKPVALVRGYDLPASVGERTLVIACSHSGNTEETLSAYGQAIAAGAMTAVITTGGRIAELASDAGAPVFAYEYEGEPRSSLGHQLMTLVALGERIGLLESQQAAVAEATALMREQRARLGYSARETQNEAKQLARRLRGRLPIVVGAGVLTEAAYRWKTQFNENSKCWAIAEQLPELDHNSIVGFGLPDVSALHAVFLRSGGLHPRVLLRYDATADALEDAGVSCEVVDTPGESALARVLAAVFHGDLVSYYLALLYGISPSPVAPIDKLKARLAES